MTYKTAKELLINLQCTDQKITKCQNDALRCVISILDDLIVQCDRGNHGLEKHMIKKAHPDYSDKEVEAYIKGYEEKELEIYNKVMEDKAEETGLHLSIYTNNNAEYLIKKDVENVLQDWALKAWKDEWKPTWESIRGDTFMEAKLIVMDLPPINMSNFINKEDVLRIIESFKVGGNQKLSKEEFERNNTLQLIQDEIQGINGFER